ETGEKVVAKREVGGGCDRPDRHDHQGADNRPKRDRPETHLSAAVLQGIAGCARSRAVTGRCGAHRGGITRMARAVAVIAVGRRVRHRPSHADPCDRRYAYNAADFTSSWLIFSKPSPAMLGAWERESAGGVMGSPGCLDLQRLD